MFACLLMLHQVFTKAHAQWSPALQYSTPQRSESIDEPNAIALPEMQSDILTYQKSPESILKWKNNKNALSVTMGSLDWFTLFADNRIKSQSEISEQLFFRIYFLEQSDFETQTRQLNFEFEKRLYTFGFVFQGSPTPNKAESDLGIAANVYRENFKLKIFQNFFDAPRNKHSHDDDYFDTSYPFVYGLILSTPDDLWSLGVRNQPLLSWHFPQFGFEVETSGFVAQSELVIPYENQIWHLQFQYDYFSHDKRNLSELHSTNITRNRTLLRTRCQLTELPNDFGAITALDVVARNWNEFDTFTLVPQATLLKQFSENWDFQMGGDVSFYKENSNSRFDSRVNLGTKWSPSESTEFTLQATFDLDEKGTKRRFQGGNAQFSLLL